jgi:hypothetical protein
MARYLGSGYFCIPAQHFNTNSLVYSMRRNQTHSQQGVQILKLNSPGFKTPLGLTNIRHVSARQGVGEKRGTSE